MAGRATGAVLFVDTSAVVRRYDRTEPGAARVRSLGDLAPFRFCTADRTQAQAARAEGLDVELIA